MKHADILLVARPGPLRDALTRIISDISCVDHLYPISSPLLALKTLTTLKPRLVLFCINTPEEEIIESLKQIKQIAPESHCLVMVETMPQGERARFAGADAVIVGNVSTRQLIESIQSALIGASSAQENH